MTEPPAPPTVLGVVFPVNMGNRGQNVFPVAELFEKLRRAQRGAEFVGYHRRLSGNFVFRLGANAEMQHAVSTAERVVGLKCLARSLTDLARVDAAVPVGASLSRTSVVVRKREVKWRVICVALSESIPPPRRFIGTVNSRIELIAWPSARDVLCLYDRPGAAGDVGQVTRAVLRRVSRSEATSTLYGTGRAMSVIRDLLAGRYVQGFVDQ